MTVTFRDITEKNFYECIHLKAQKFVASNLYSIAQSKVIPYLIIKGIYTDEKMVGFVMYSLNMKQHELYLYRFMIDRKYQHKGYGKAALDVLKKTAMEADGINSMKLSTDRNNKHGIKVYEKFGFVDTGLMEDEEEVFVLKLEK